jgi:hypothetical protein
MPYLQSLVKNEDQITLSPSPNNGVRVFSSPANGNLDMGQYNIVNAGSIALGGPGLDEATVFFTNTLGTFPLQADGDNLYFDGQLLAKATDIQTIDQWADYPAAFNVDMDNKNVENVANIAFQGQGATYLNVIAGRLNYGSVPVAAQWAAYSAANNVDMGTRSLNNLRDINQIVAGTANLQTVNIAGNLTQSVGGTASLQTVGVAGNLTQSAGGIASLQTVGVAGNLTQSAGGIASLQTVGVAGNLTQSNGQLARLPALQTSTIGTISGGAANNLSFSNTDSVAGFQYRFNSGNVAVDTVQTLTGARPQLLNGVALNLGPSGTYGNLTTDAAGSVLSWNGQPITAGGGGNAATWSLYPAINNTILPNPGITGVPLTIGTRSSAGGSVLVEANGNFNVNADDTIQFVAAYDDATGESLFRMTDTTHTLLIDRGNSVLGQATMNLTAKNGTGGRINIYAESSAGSGPAGGGLVDITAYSSVGSVSPLSLSRVNVEAATITIAAGALGGGIAFVPGSVNIVSGLGTGVQILTTVGPINIAGGTSATLAGGLGVYFDGASAGVNVAGGQTLFVDKVFPRTVPGKVQIPLLDITSPSGSINFGYNATSITADVIGIGSGSVGTIFVSPSGNDTTGNGSAISPYATIAKAITVAAAIADSIPVVIQLFAGTFAENVSITRANTFINGLSAVAQECYINGAVSFLVNTSTLPFITGGMSGVRMNSLVCGGTPVVQTEYTFINCVILSASTVVPFTASQGGSVSYTVVMDGCTLSPTDTRAAGLTSVAVSFLRCLLSVLTGNSAVFVQGSGTVSIDNCELSSSYAGTDATALLTIANNIAPTVAHRVSQSRLFYTSATTDIGGAKCCIRFTNNVAVSAVVNDCYFNCVGAITGTPLIQCIQKVGTATVNLQYGNIQAVSPAVWINPGITRTILNSVQQGVNAVGGGAGDYLVWDGNQWASGSTTVSIGRGSGNATDTTCVNIGNGAGTSANTNAVAIGNGAGAGTTANSVIAIGTSAGSAAGASSIHIGQNAGSAGGNNANTIVLNATGVALNPTAASTCKIAPIRNASLTPATFTASSAGDLTYNNATSEVCFNTTSYKCSLLVSPATLALNPTLLGSTYIITGTGTLTFTSTALTAGDTGFFIYLKNGTSPATDITLAGIAGATILHRETGSQNGQMVVLFWNGTTLTAY